MDLPSSSSSSLARRREQARRSSASLITVGKQVARNSKNLSPFDKSHRLPVMRQNDVASTVARLFDASCPSNVGRFIVSIVIDPFDLMIRAWFGGQICDEQANVVPSGTNGNSSPAVILVRPVFVVVATGHHSVPRRVKR